MRFYPFSFFFFFQAEDGIRDFCLSRGLGDVYKRQAIENQVNSKVEKEVIQKDEILGQESRDNSENAKALTGIVLKYKEKTGWDYEKGRGVVEAIKEALGSSVPENTLNAMAAYLKTRMYSLMGTTSGVTETERTYNTVNVNGYTEMNYTCYAKTRKTTLSTTVCLLYTSPSPRDRQKSRMPSSA